ncbi:MULTISPECIES: replication factor C large subunit [unclassified Methanoculleus]|uniref:replication factor C large subunit n=1 Tax=unclassified Methanoculleus TaxID=2619537 RepID=UPI00260019E0|nr:MULTISPECIES: replication factor C large subunit [unclassified Methanoculleus]MCK9316988.1 replication factor C large subunit [Methanoculleus sp.]MDD2252862.1 replication factor C large subunit [Methanoculleus sp.]MDD2787234.1 replication factor C large subunit [Methanoculleus sp.]MDD3215721.1 replication factor C large subunit [Methanoculleus sp.]MDD4313520.1 replication factor C large subunit [Methanoculleus sp.]
MDWVEKYRPQRLQDVVGNSGAVRQMYEWARDWSRQKKPLLLYGKPGIGKTSSAHALANDMNWEVVELNASDQRTKAALERVAGSGSTTASLSGASRKLILLDEADNLHGQADRGGAKAILEIIAASQQPMILIANDYYSLSRELKAATEPVQFRAFQARSIVPRLRQICAAEGVACDPLALDEIGRRAGGDMRAAVNMLYAAAIGKEHLATGDVHTSAKDQRSTIFELVGAVFSGRRDADLLRMAVEVEDTPDTIEQWLEGSIDQMPDHASRTKGYACLARADEYIGRTYRRQYYTLWRYANAVMLLGVADAAGGHGIHGRIMPPSRWQKMGASKKQKTVRAGLSRKLSEMTHTPEDALREEFFTAISILIEQDPAGYVREFQLDADELALFIHDKARAVKVVKEVAKEEKAKEKKASGKEKNPAKGKKPRDDDPPGDAEARRDPPPGQATLF